VPKAEALTEAGFSVDRVQLVDGVTVRYSAKGAFEVVFPSGTLAPPSMGGLTAQIPAAQFAALSKPGSVCSKLGSQ
jgi:hypothetical protein